MSRKLDGKVALITGSSRGIGKAIAVLMASEGASIIVNAGNSVREGKKTLSVLKKIGGQSHIFCRGDIGNEKDIKKIAAIVKNEFGRVDILVNNAGVTKFIPHNKLDKLSPEIFDMIYRVNLRGPYLVIREFERLLRRSKNPAIINIATVGASTAMGSNVAYCAMKAGLINITKSLARALAPDIRVNSVSPGLTETEFIKSFGKYKSEQKRKTPLGRLAKPEDIAAAVLALVTDMTYVTGQDIIVDGGRILG